MNEQPSIREIALAGMLHDIGKLGQRTERQDPFVELENVYCPHNMIKNYYSHRHVLYTYEFVEKHKDVFPDDVRPSLVASIAAGHHKPSNAAQQIIRFADWASAGADRMKDAAAVEGKYYEIALRSVFDALEAGETSLSSEKENRYALKPLQAGSWIPQQALSLTRADYSKCEGQFLEEFVRLAGYNGSAFEVSLDALMERHLWSIPSSSRDARDVSLYDHSRTTAAFAAVIHAYVQHNSLEYDDLNSSTWHKQHQPFLFVSGDLSGIQNYVFDLRSHGRSAKLLRARSYELQVLARGLAEHILGEMDLPLWCTLFSSAGRMLLLLPNSHVAHEIIRSSRQRIESTMLDTYKGLLSFNLSSGVAAGLDQMNQQNMAAHFDAVRADVQEAKQRKLQSALMVRGHILDPIADSENGVCSSCGLRPATEEIPVFAGDSPISAEQPAAYLCSHCAELERMGARMPKAEYIVFRRSTSNGTLRPKVLINPSVEKVTPAETVYQVNNFVAGRGVVRTAFHLPEEDGLVLDFREIAKPLSGVGAPHIAMLKADVDRLGWIFSRGLGASFSLSRYVTLSRMLDLFFTGHIVSLLKDDPRYRNVYTVFSGGDDLCLIGHWETMLNLAHVIHGDFLSFVGAGNTVTLSMGLSLSSPHLPVSTMSDIAEDALKESKQDRNRITVFGATYTWEQYSMGLQEGEWLTELLRTDDKVSTGTVYRLLQFNKLRKECEEVGAESATRKIKKRALLWRSSFRYYLTRNWPGVHHERIIKLVEINHAALPLAVSYALYAIRSARRSE